MRPFAVISQTLSVISYEDDRSLLTCTEAINGCDSRPSSRSAKRTSSCRLRRVARSARPLVGYVCVTGEPTGTTAATFRRARATQSLDRPQRLRALRFQAFLRCRSRLMLSS